MHNAFLAIFYNCLFQIKRKTNICLPKYFSTLVVKTYSISFQLLMPPGKILDYQDRGVDAFIPLDTSKKSSSREKKHYYISLEQNMQIYSNTHLEILNNLTDKKIQELIMTQPVIWNLEHVTVLKQSNLYRLLVLHKSGLGYPGVFCESRKW